MKTQSLRKILNRRNILKLFAAFSGMALLQFLFNNCSPKGFRPASSLGGEDQPSNAAPTPPTPTPPPSGVLPKWIPAPGTVSKLTIENGGLTNRFADIVAPYYEPFHSIKIVNDYSTHIYNHFWGTWGALIGFGGGHSATNDNTVWALEFGLENCTFKRLTNPAPIFGTGTDSLTKSKNSGYEGANGFRVSIEAVYGEYEYPGKNTIEPAAPHSYGALDIIGPQNGGAPSGSLVTVVTAAPGTAGNSTTTPSYGQMVAAHKCDFPATSGTPGQYAWERITDIPGDRRAQGAPAWTQIVSAQNRIYLEMRAATAIQNPFWFDLATKQYVAGSGTPRTNNADGSDTGIMFYVPERNILIHADRFMGKVRIQYMKVSAYDTNPSWVTLVQLNVDIPATPSWQCACWCPDNSRLILSNVADDPNCVYEIEIPEDLLQTWNAVRVPFPSGQTISWPGRDDQAGSPTYKKWSYCERVRAIVYIPSAKLSSQGPEEIYIYRPRAT